MSPSRPESNLERPPSLASRLYRFANKPYYWYRPSQLAIRLRAKLDDDESEHLLRTAWGSHLYCWPDPLGRAVARTGVYDLVVAETLARLADPGETAIDAGANVGFMSNVLAHAVGPTGRVTSFEPHPVILQTLARNVSRWKASEGIDVVHIRPAAVSSAAGMLPLAVDPDTFADNKGTASVEYIDPSSATQVEVKTVRLDEEFSAPVGVLKLDVEGHELSALKGAESLLSRGLIRDIIFEEHRLTPTPVTEFLESHSYTVLGARQGLTRPILSAPADVYYGKMWDPPALLATREPERLRERLSRRGWVCLRRNFHQPALV
jgi:FkbM family methyltransferase